MHSASQDSYSHLYSNFSENRFINPRVFEKTRSPE